MERPGAAAAEDEEDERANHGEIGAGVTDHEPEPLGMGEFGEFGTGDGGRDNKEKWDSSEAGPKAEEDERAADDFETADEVRREGGLRKADASETFDAHFGIGKFEEALGEEDQADGKADDEDTRRASVGLEEEAAERVHG